MRKHLAVRAAEEAEPEESPLEGPEALVVNAFGPRTAAWLVYRHKRRFHLVGRVRFQEKTTVLKRFTPPGKKLFWFAIAIESLRRRPGWSVTKTEHRGMTTYEVQWLNWMVRARGNRG